MKSFRAVFQIVEDNNCPLYALEDIFVLTEKSIAFPEGKESCLILVRELTQLLFQLLGEGSKGDFKKRYSCSGCTGLIKFQQIADENSELGGDIASLLSEKEQILFDKIHGYPLLKSIPVNHLKKFLSCFRGKIIKKNEFLITKGQLNEHLYVLLSGNIVVEDGEVPITRLSEGEVCGEMSYFGDSIAGTSVRALEDTKVLAISGKDFGKLINKSGAVQMYMARLLAERLSKANAVRAHDFEACMQGRINDMVPAELLQVFHMHQKTGVLSLELPRGKGRISFLEGSIVVANYDGKKGQDAVFAVLGEREGVYNFTSGLPEKEMQQSAIGDFMMLLMEGVKRFDED
jgi:CRP/FNR family transcriptional regulator, cyclic AMP receptor protein